MIIRRKKIANCLLGYAFLLAVINGGVHILGRFGTVHRIVPYKEYSANNRMVIHKRNSTEWLNDGHSIRHDNLVYGARTCDEDHNGDCAQVLFPLEENGDEDTTSQVKCRNVTLLKSPLLSYPMCFYPIDEDWYISGSVSRGRLWEAHFIQQMGRWLQADPRYGLIDIGANIGTYSLAAAHLGHQAVAVEPLSGNLQRLKRSVMLGRINRNVTIVEAGIGDSRTTFFLRVGMTNKGDIVAVDKETCLAVNRSHHTCDPKAPIQVIYMDDLLPVIRFTKAVLKIDIEGYEMKAFAHAQKIFEQINISHVMMEWTTYKWPEHNDSESARKEVQEFIDFFIRRGYTPHSPALSPLNIASWIKWPNDVIWVKKGDIN